MFLDTLDWFCLYFTDRLYLEDAIYAWTKNCLLLLSCKLSGMDDDQECWPGTAVSAAAAIWLHCGTSYYYYSLCWCWLRSMTKALRAQCWQCSLYGRVQLNSSSQDISSKCKVQHQCCLKEIEFDEFSVDAKVVWMSKFSDLFSKIDVKFVYLEKVARLLSDLLRYCWASTQFLSRSVAYN